MGPSSAILQPSAPSASWERSPGCSPSVYAVAFAPGHSLPSGCPEGTPINAPERNPVAYRFGLPVYRNPMKIMQTHESACNRFRSGLICLCINRLGRVLASDTASLRNRRSEVQILSRAPFSPPIQSHFPTAIQSFGFLTCTMCKQVRTRGFPTVADLPQGFAVPPFFSGKTCRPKANQRLRLSRNVKCRDKNCPSPDPGTPPTRLVWELPISTYDRLGLHPVEGREGRE